MFRSTAVWRAAGEYELALDPWAGPKPVLRCRRAAGREVKKVPTALKDDPVVRELTALAEWIGDHAARALSNVESWMTQSLPVPAALIREVWPDPYWRRALRYAVIAPSDESGGAIDVARAGVLTEVVARPGGALVVRGLDGAERELGADIVVIPHPVLLDPRGSGLLERWQDVLGPLGGEQGIEQVNRAVYARPDCSPAPGARPAHQGMTVFQNAVHESGARFEALVRRFGGRIGGERAGFSFGHRGRAYGLVADLRHQGPAAPVTLHGFRFTDCSGRHGAGAYDVVPRPVWSEGIRAAATLYDGRDGPVSGSAGSPPDDAGSAYQAFLVACAEYAAAGAPDAGPGKPMRAAGTGELLDAGAVLAGEAGPGEEVLAARHHGSTLFEDGGCFVRLVVGRAVEAEDAVARALGLVPESGGPVPVGRVPVRPLDLLSRVCGAHPELAREAMGLLAPLRACARTAETKPGRAAADLRSSLQKLTAPHPELLPYALDEGARIVAAAGSVAMARPLYAAARTAEQRLGGVDEGALRELVSEFRELGVVDEKLLGTYRTELAARSSAGEAYESWRQLVRDWLREESRTPVSSARDGVTHVRGRNVPRSFAGELTEGVAGSLEADDTNTEIFHLLLRHRGFEEVSASVWEAWAAPLERDLAEHADTAKCLRSHLPKPRGSSAAAKTAAAEAWLRLMARVGLLEEFTGGAEPDAVEAAKAADAWLTSFFGQYAGLRLPVAGLEPVVAAVAARMRAAGAARGPLLALRSRSLGGDFWGVGMDLGLLALMKSMGMPLGELEDEQGVFALQWIQRRGTAGVEPVLADPVFQHGIRGELTGSVRGSLGYTVTRHCLTPFPKVTKRVAALEPLRELMTGILDERVRRVRDRKPDAGAAGLFAVQDLLLHVEPFVVAGAAKPFAAQVREALAVEPAGVLADALRGCCRTRGAASDRVAPCGLRDVSVGHARELLAAVDDAVRDRHVRAVAVEPGTRRSRFLDFRPGSEFARDLMPVVEKTLPEIADDSCRASALGVVQGVLWCEAWQASLRRRLR
ncbi:DUF4132 domain-containing protein [Streptomyces venezuelae]|uniref:DUF4132 domain-containing protein n=1 Tax=Streptomyces venezuelae TaxID=54571 RepID=UPI00278BCA1B|nr:DUF4132 domain-containing protein [Streptomyces venezuelae]